MASSAGKRGADRDGDGELEFHERQLAFMEEVAEWNPLGFALLITMVIAPPTVLYHVMLPCWDCADFEAAILRPGTFWGWDIQTTFQGTCARTPQLQPRRVATKLVSGHARRGRRTNAGNCHHLWQGVVNGTPPGATDLDLGSMGYYVRNSVMEAFTQHNPRPCLTDDDVEALAVLIPIAHPPRSLKTFATGQPFGRLVRLAAYVLTPILIALFCILIFSSMVHRYQRDELREARAAAANAKRQFILGKRSSRTQASAADPNRVHSVL